MKVREGYVKDAVKGIIDTTFEVNNKCQPSYIYIYISVLGHFRALVG